MSASCRADPKSGVVIMGCVGAVIAGGGGYRRGARCVNAHPRRPAGCPGLDPGRRAAVLWGAVFWGALLQGVGDRLADGDQDRVGVVPLDAAGGGPCAEQAPERAELPRAGELGVHVDDVGRYRRRGSAASDEVAGRDVFGAADCSPTGFEHPRMDLSHLPQDLWGVRPGRTGTPTGSRTGGTPRWPSPRIAGTRPCDRVPLHRRPG